jgi:hypothetical protein
VDEVFMAPNPKKRSFELTKLARERAKRDKESRAAVSVRHEL